ncbi:YicC family protein [Halalkalibacillus sediminis]|uniref:YicC family protein n=1 Tax=Halalkalibacillus sediminis TaxID=2018042 RepID=A0A2I0QW68_9BACI|nr:YicC/YloC family endoribonuclease [Halalkalibacillus sediminis]PKR78565.1 YicC family protein [Halalkalibacillus sediminis]
MVKSMTGFGSASGKFEETTVTIEIKTINHRFLDYSLKMPRDLMQLEDSIRKRIQEVCSRGRVEFYVNISGEPLRSRTLKVDWDLLQQYSDRMEEISDHTPIQGELEMKDLLNIEGLFLMEEATDINEEFKNFFIRLVDEALSIVSSMRSREGESLEVDVKSRLTSILESAEYLKQRSPEFQQNFQDKVTARIEESLNDTSKDEVRIIQEVALLAEKGDITEEITRIISHVKQFEETLDLEEPIGRKLDFISQELLREANTIGSKSNDVSISKVVVDLKSEIEKIKEQVQNIE